MESKGQLEGRSGLRVSLLGGFDVGVGAIQVPPESWRRRKPAALLKILALASGQRAHREVVLDLLWPELEPAAGRQPA